MDAIVLAAGMSRRMGKLKALLPFGDAPMIARVVQSLQNAQCFDSITVVTGHAREEIEAALRDFDVRFAHNANFGNGEMIDSVQTGVRAIESTLDEKKRLFLFKKKRPFLLSLGDQPLIESESITGLCRDWNEVSANGEFPMLVPLYRGRRGHPVIFSHKCKREILQLEAGQTLKTITQRHRDNTLEVQIDDAGIVTDIDTPEDYEIALQKWRRLHSRGT